MGRGRVLLWLEMRLFAAIEMSRNDEGL
jgi:hypothetical protein